ncbi:hypothetical protein GGF37_007153, partial [Kickxella alabastrina]
MSCAQPEDKAAEPVSHSIANSESESESDSKFTTTLEPKHIQIEATSNDITADSNG